MNRIVNESDWKLFRKLLPGWQEAYMDKLCNEYLLLLSSDKASSDKFWELKKRINEDRKLVSVCAEMRRSMMYCNLISLINEGAITLDDLSCFSDELQQDFARLFRQAQ